MWMSYLKQALVESLKKEKAIMESELKQEVEKNDRCLQQLQSMDQLKVKHDRYKRV